MRYWFRLSLLLLTVGLSACATTGSLGSSPALWHIQHQGEELWLFGTIHRLPNNQATSIRRKSATRINRTPPMSWKTLALRKAMDKSDTLLVEMLPLDGNALLAALTKAADKRATMGQPLQQLLSQDDQTVLYEAAEKRGIQPELLSKADPLTVLSLFSNTAPRHSNTVDRGADYWLIVEASYRRLEIDGLEMLDDRLNALHTAVAQLADREQAQVFMRFLETELGELSVDDPEYRELVRLWASGNTQELGLRMEKYQQYLPTIYQAFIAARNEAWIRNLESHWLNNGENEFVAVGIGHLVGPNNLVDLLRQRGYQITRVQ